MSRQNLEMLCLTWNVNEQQPEDSPLFKWIADLSAKASLVVVALQEIEMGGGSVAIAAAKDVLKKSAQVWLFSARFEQLLRHYTCCESRRCCQKSPQEEVGTRSTAAAQAEQFLLRCCTSC